MNRREFIAAAALATGVIAARAGTVTTPRDFTELDPIYRNRAVRLDGLCWYDAFEVPFVLEGVPFRDKDGVPTCFQMGLMEKMTHPDANGGIIDMNAGEHIRKVNLLNGGSGDKVR